MYAAPARMERFCERSGKGTSAASAALAMKKRASKRRGLSGGVIARAMKSSVARSGPTPSAKKGDR